MTGQENKRIVRQVDNDAYLGTLKELILEGREVSLLISGSSMAPFLIHHRDTVFLGPVKQPLKKGTIVFYQRDNGAYVLHRIYKVKKGGYYDIVGDAQTQIEENVRADQIFAVVTMVRRKGKDIREGDFWWEFFEHVWIRLIPLRRGLIRCFGAVCGER